MKGNKIFEKKNWSENDDKWEERRLIRRKWTMKMIMNEMLMTYISWYYTCIEWQERERHLSSDNI